MIAAQTTSVVAERCVSLTPLPPYDAKATAKTIGLAQINFAVCQPIRESLWSFPTNEASELCREAMDRDLPLPRTSAAARLKRGASYGAHRGKHGKKPACYTPRTVKTLPLFTFVPNLQFGNERRKTRLLYKKHGPQTATIHRPSPSHLIGLTFFLKKVEGIHHIMSTQYRSRGSERGEAETNRPSLPLSSSRGGGSSTASPTVVWN